MKISIGIWIRIAVNLQIALCSMPILTTLGVSIHENIFLFICACLMSFINVLQFSVNRIFTSLVKFIPRYFILFDAVINRMNFLISPYDSLFVEIQLFFKIDFASGNLTE